MTNDLRALVAEHVADLRRCAVILDRMAGLAKTAAEIRKAADELQSALDAQAGGWLPIESAPKGGGAEYRTHPDYVEPPQVLLLFKDGEQSVGYWDWYYAENGSGQIPGMAAWVEPVSGERVAGHYGEPIRWQPLSAGPVEGGGA